MVSEKVCVGGVIVWRAGLVRRSSRVIGRVQGSRHKQGSGFRGLGTGRVQGPRLQSRSSWLYRTIGAHVDVGP